MTLRYLPICLLLLSNLSYAKDYEVASDNNPPVSDNVSHLSMPRPGRYGGDGGGVRIFLSGELGDMVSTTTAPDLKYSGGGFMYTSELGVKLRLPGNNGYRSSTFSISLAFTQGSPAQKYKDAVSGESKKSKLHIDIFSLPFSFTSVHNGKFEDALGWYWQVGVNPGYISGISSEGHSATTSYNSFCLEPSVSVGLRLAFIVLKNHQEVGSGHILTGPFFKDEVLNIAKPAGMSMHTHTIGWRCAYVF